MYWGTQISVTLFHSLQIAWLLTTCGILETPNKNVRCEKGKWRDNSNKFTWSRFIARACQSASKFNSGRLTVWLGFPEEVRPCIGKYITVHPNRMVSLSEFSFFKPLHLLIRSYQVPVLLICPLALSRVKSFFVLQNLVKQISLKRRRERPLSNTRQHWQLTNGRQKRQNGNENWLL